MAGVLNEWQVRFLEKARIARLGTINPDGTPHIAPVWYRYEDGEMRILTDRGSQKYKNIERDPRVTVCVDDETPPYRTVLMRGTAAVTESPGAAWRLALAVHYLGEERGRRYVEQNNSETGIMLRITAENVGGW
jgi:PPOX class probable F420-dependent enzyme